MPSLLFRLSAGPCLASLLLGAGLAPALHAQTVVPAAPDDAQQASVVPPERAGRVAQISGTASFHTADQEEWSPAAVNYPVATGDALWTEPDVTAWLEISSSRIALAGSTELDVDNLDQSGLQATVAQGETYWHLRDLAPDETWSVVTPRGTVTFSGAGRYGVTAGDTAAPTVVTVLDGSAQLSGPGFSLTVAAGQTATVSGADSFQASIGPAQVDAFLSAMQQAERPPRPPAVAPPPVVAAMPGGDDLTAYGTWARTPEYGEVWYPNVPAGWVPYREGHWAYVAPWGWTWIDNEPWGFAPFHYGRWAQIRGRWAWTPGTVQVAAPPVYAPALVTFFGIGAAVGAGVALESGRVGWAPLGPHEAYHPWYHAPETYVRAVNRHEVTDLTVINQHITINNIIDRPGVTVVPARAMAESRPVRQVEQKVDPHLLAGARPLAGTPPVRPTAVTAGITPRLAQRLHLAAPAGAPAVAHVAAGPAIRPPPHVAGHATAPARPPLRPAAVRPVSPEHGAPPAGAAQVAHPRAGTPQTTHPSAVASPGAAAGASPGASHGASAGASPGASPDQYRPPATGTRPGEHVVQPAGAAPAQPHTPEPSRAAPATHGPAAPPHPAPAHPSPPHQAPEQAMPPHRAPEHAAPPHPGPEHAGATRPEPPHPAAEHQRGPEPHPAAPHPAVPPHPAPQPNPHPAAAAHPPPAAHPAPGHDEHEKRPGEH